MPSYRMLELDTPSSLEGRQAARGMFTNERRIHKRTNHLGNQKADFAGNAQGMETRRLRAWRGEVH